MAITARGQCPFSSTQEAPAICTVGRCPLWDGDAAACSFHSSAGHGGRAEFIKVRVAFEHMPGDYDEVYLSRTFVLTFSPSDGKIVPPDLDMMSYILHPDDETVFLDWLMA